MSKRSDKMYANSPRLERKEDGQMGITKAQKESARVNDGTSGMPINESHVVDLQKRHALERLELYQKQEKDFLVSVASGATGAELINKVEQNKGE